MITAECKYLDTSKEMYLFLVSRNPVTFPKWSLNLADFAEVYSDDEDASKKKKNSAY